MRYAIHYFRYVLGFDDGRRADAGRTAIRASSSSRREHTGAAIVGVAANGDVVALDPRTGAVRARKSLGTTAPVLGATFDADGWAPSGAERAGRDRRRAGRDRARSRCAVRSGEGARRAARSRSSRAPQVTAELLAILADARAAAALKDTVVELLVAAARSGEPAGADRAARGARRLPREDRARGARAGRQGDRGPGRRGRSIRRTWQPRWPRSRSTSTRPAPRRRDLVQVIAAMAAIGGGAERAALGVAPAPLSRRGRSRRRRRVAEGDRHRARAAEWPGRACAAGLRRRRSAHHARPDRR